MPLLTQKTRYELFELSAGDRGGYLTNAMFNSQQFFCHLLFLFTVKDFQSAPTKTKAFFIWERFLAPNMVHVENFEAVPGLDIAVECDRDNLTGLSGQITVMKAQQDAAKRMSWAQRKWTASSRVPSAILFNAVVDKICKKTGDNAFGDIEARLHSTTTWSGSTWQGTAKKYIPTLLTELAAAGFDGTKSGYSSVRGHLS